MSAKRRILPRPCPICGRKNGIVQFTIFPKSLSPIVCRIGHYIAEAYKKPNKIPIDEEIDPLGRSYTTKTRKAKTRGRVWHNFRIDPNFSKYGWNSRLEKYLYKLEKISDSLRYQRKESISFRMTPDIYHVVKQEGWCRKPYSGNYHGRPRNYADN